MEDDFKVGDIVEIVDNNGLMKIYFPELGGRYVVEGIEECSDGQSNCMVKLLSPIKNQIKSMYSYRVRLLPKLSFTIKAEE